MTTFANLDHAHHPWGPFKPAATERIVRWKNVTRWTRKQYKRIWIDVAKLDAMTRLDRGRYVGFAGQGGISGKYEGVDDFIIADTDRLHMPRVGITSTDHGKIAYIRDGRHRFAWMRDHGAQALPVEVEVDEALAVAGLVGTKCRVCRVTMWRIPEWDVLSPSW
jgi:hypothetical protein